MPDCLRPLDKKRKILLCCFLFILLILFALPWFGHKNIAEVRGFIILQHPTAILGILLFLLSIFSPMKKKLYCFITGGAIGLFLLFLTEIIEFLTIKYTGTKGFSFFIFNYTVIPFDKINLSESFSYALPGFYFGILFLIFTFLTFLTVILILPRKH